jgi:hypothetical protein
LQQQHAIRLITEGEVEDGPVPLHEPFEDDVLARTNESWNHVTGSDEPGVHCAATEPVERRQSGCR